jgi:hypothetical protein
MRLPSLRKLVKRVLILAACVFGLFVATIVLFFLRCSSTALLPKPLSAAAQQRRAITAGIKDYARPEEDTFITYPEWYIVWSYQEKADYQENHLPSGFAYFASIARYWDGYCCAHRLTRGRYPFNVGDHVMLAVIGTSFSVEYAIKAAYENTVGRFTEWLSGHDPAEEDRYAYQTARAYADFVHIRPFYEFSFWKRFKGMWSETHFWGAHPIRKWERKIFLSIDYGIEALYCWVIEKGTHASYGVEPSETYVWIENAGEDVFAQEPALRKVQAVGSGAFIAIIPRYQEFTDVAVRLARRNVHFVEIAGNDEIALTVLAPSEWKPAAPGAEFLFSMPLATHPETVRVAMRAPVSALHEVLNGLSGPGVRLEHIYDY